MAESDEREDLVSDLSMEEYSIQVSPVLISECDNVRTAISVPDSDHDDPGNLVLKPIEENSVVEIIWDAEDTVMDPKVLS